MLKIVAIFIMSYTTQPSNCNSVRLEPIDFCGKLSVLIMQLN